MAVDRCPYFLVLVLARFIAAGEYEAACRFRDGLEECGYAVPPVGRDDVNPGFGVMANLYAAMQAGLGADGDSAVELAAVLDAFPPPGGWIVCLN